MGEPRAIRVRPLLLVGILAAGGCQRTDLAANAADTIVAVRSGRVDGLTAARRSPPSSLIPAARPTAMPTIAASPPGPNPQLAKPAFRSPPLPPELTGDGGLEPLPPLPPPSAFSRNRQP